VLSIEEAFERSASNMDMLSPSESTTTLLLFCHSRKESAKLLLSTSSNAFPQITFVHRYALSSDDTLRIPSVPISRLNNSLTSSIVDAFERSASDREENSGFFSTATSSPAAFPSGVSLSSVISALSSASSFHC